MPLIAADDAAGRMHENMVATAGTFRMQGLAHAQRAFMAVSPDGAPAVARVVQP